VNRFLNALERAAKKTGHIGEVICKDVGKVALATLPLDLALTGDLADVLIPEAGPAVHLLGKLISGGEPMDLEQMGIAIIMDVINTTLKTPAKKAALETQLLTLAADLQLAYGLTPPANPAQLGTAAK
jgi:hypothetical protein